MASLQFEPNYWDTRLSGMKNASIQTKLHLILSLVIFLGVSVQHLLNFIFSTDVKSVRDRASRYMGFTPSAMDDSSQFHPSALYQLWHENWPNSRKHLHQMIKPCANEIILQESDRIITDPALQVRIKDLTISDLRGLLAPDKLIKKYQDNAPFMFELMRTFSASPNKYRKSRTRKEAREGESRAFDNQDSGSGSEDEWNDDPNLDFDTEDRGTDWWNDIEGFSRNPIHVRDSHNVLVCAYSADRPSFWLSVCLLLFAIGPPMYCHFSSGYFSKSPEQALV
jgi:hypothetical protein